MSDAVMPAIRSQNSSSSSRRSPRVERADRAFAGASVHREAPEAQPDENRAVEFNDYPIFPVEEWS
jgi:hypothetical protein